MIQENTGIENKPKLISFLCCGALLGGALGYLLSFASATIDFISGAKLAIVIFGWWLMLGLPAAIVLTILDRRRQSAASGTFLRALAGSLLFMVFFMGAIFFLASIPRWTQALTQAEGEWASTVSSLIGFGGGAVAGLLWYAMRLTSKRGK